MQDAIGMTLGELIIASVALLAALVALFIGVSTLRQSASLQRREYKARLLDELKEWALNLQSAEMPIIPTINALMATARIGGPGEKARVALAKAEVALKCASVLFEGSYVRELGEKVFKSELGETLRRIDNVVPAITYLKSRDAGTPYAVNPHDREMVEKLEENLKSGKRTLEQLLNEHRELLQKQVGELLTKIADVKAKLL